MQNILTENSYEASIQFQLYSTAFQQMRPGFFQRPGAIQAIYLLTYTLALSMHLHITKYLTGCSMNQVAQLWQEHRTKLASFSINVQLYSLNHFLSHPLVASGNISALSESFYAKKLCSKCRECQFYL